MIGLFEGVGGVKAVIMTRISGLDTACERKVYGSLSAFLAGGLKNLLSICRVPSGVHKVGMVV